jgi:hypothetical protein
LWGVFQDRVLWTICLGLASNHDPPDLCLLSSWDYRREPLVLAQTSLPEHQLMSQHCLVLSPLELQNLNSGSRHSREQDRSGLIPSSLSSWPGFHLQDRNTMVTA